MADQKILDRIRKLLRLSTSDNVHEAANAAAKAQNLIERHRVSRAQLEQAEEEIRYHKDRPMDTAQRVPIWKSRLAASICEANDCTCVYVRWKHSSGDLLSSLVIVGRDEDADASRYLYAYLVREIDRLTALKGKGRGRTYATDFRLGCVETIDARLRQAKRAARRSAKVGTRALARLDSRLATVRHWQGSHLGTAGNLNVDAAIGDATARIRGRIAGAGIDLGGRNAALNRGRAKLKG